MTELPDLKQLSDEAKDALILTLWEALQKLQKKRPKKTSKNSSLPPAKGFKAEVKSEEKGSGQTRVGSLGRAGGGRPLSEHPDQIIESSVKTCQDCGAEIARSEQQRMARYDKIDIPPIAPIVSRIERYGCRCPQCGSLAVLRRSRLIGSDETSARVNGKNQWEWVFQNEHVCFHIIRPSRGGNVITEVMADHRPQVWVSDLFSAQKTHPGESWQVCLAHQLRDCQYGMDAGDEIFSARMKTLLLRAFVLQRRWLDLAQSTRYQYRCRLYRDLKAVLALSPTQADGIRLQNRYRELQGNLFLFLDDTTIPPTNNASEQALRWSVIFRKVTNGFRSEWGRDLFAPVRSIVNTGRRQGFSAFESILAALNPLESLFPLS